MKKLLLIPVIILCLLVIVAIVLIGITIYNHNNPTVSYPTEGIWFCEELGIQINFDGYNDNFIKIGDEYYVCWFDTNRGSSLMFIRSQDVDLGENLGESLFTGEHVRSDDHSFSVRDTKTSRVYTFKRNDSYVSIPATQYLFIDVSYYSIEEIRVGFQNVFYDKISSLIKQGTEPCCGTEFLSGAVLTYDLYCTQENRTSKKWLDFEGKVYLYVAITAIGEEKVDIDNETHLFGFCLTYEGVQASLYDEVHSANEGVSKYLPADAEKLGSFTMQINSNDM